MGIGKELSYLRLAPTEMNSEGEVKSRGLLIDRKERRIGQIAWNQFADSALGFDDRARVFRVRLLFR